MKVERLVIVTADAAAEETISRAAGTDSAHLFSAFLNDTLAACSHPEVRAALWLSTDRDVALSPTFTAVQRIPGGSRESLLERGFAEGYKYVCFVGSATPHLPTSFVQEAFGRLTPSRVTGAGVEAVWGPTEDGGYALVAFRQSLRELVTVATTQKAEERSQEEGIGYHLLPRWYRVYNRGDLVRLAQDIQRGVVFAQETAKVLTNLRL